MATVLNPYLNFRDNARQAMEFYREVFGGNLTSQTFADLHAAVDPGEEDLVMHSDLEGPDGIRFMAADTPKHMDLQPGTNFSMSLSGEDEGKLRGGSRSSRTAVRCRCRSRGPTGATRSGCARTSSA